MKQLFQKRWIILILFLAATLNVGSAVKIFGYEYTGTIGPYKVVFQEEFFNIAGHGPSRSFCYRYLNNRVNRGDWICCTEERMEGNYEIYYEWINEKHTGTFKIIINRGTSIKGTFTNSKGKRYNVSARCTDKWGSI